MRLCVSNFDLLHVSDGHLGVKRGGKVGRVHRSYLISFFSASESDILASSSRLYRSRTVSILVATSSCNSLMCSSSTKMSFQPTSGTWSTCRKSLPVSESSTCSSSKPRRFANCHLNGYFVAKVAGPPQTQIHVFVHSDFEPSSPHGQKVLNSLRKIFLVHFVSSGLIN